MTDAGIGIGDTVAVMAVLAQALVVADVGELRVGAERLEVGVAEPLELRAAERKVELRGDRA